MYDVKMIDLNALVALCDIELSNAMKEAGIEMVNNDDELTKAINELAAEERAEKLKAAARSIVNATNFSNSSVTELVLELRNLRNRENFILAKIKKINEAKAYASETRNYIPLLKLLNVNPKAIMNFSNSVITEVPSDWKPKVQLKPKEKIVIGKK